MAVCRTMLMAHRDAVNHEETTIKRQVYYDDYDLCMGIDFARYRLEEKCTHFPHDTDIECRLFIRWAKNERKLIRNENKKI